MSVWVLKKSAEITEISFFQLILVSFNQLLMNDLLDFLAQNLPEIHK